MECRGNPGKEEVTLDLSFGGRGAFGNVELGKQKKGRMQTELHRPKRKPRISGWRPYRRIRREIAGMVEL